MLQNIDPTKKIFQLSRILSDTTQDKNTQLLNALEFIAGSIEADRVYIGLWHNSNQTMTTAAQWYAKNLEPMPENVIKIGNPSLLEEYLEQNAGMFTLLVEPIFLEHRLVGLICLESSVPIDPPPNKNEQHFVQLTTHLLAPFLVSSQASKSSEETNLGVPLNESSEENLTDDTPLLLIVEDNKINQYTMSKIWQRIGVQIQIADNGKGAIELCRKRKFNLILMDINMPIMDGFDTTREIVTSCPNNKKTPIVAVTAVTDPGIKTRCSKVGMADYVAKPIRLEGVRELAKKYLSDLV